MVFRVQGRDSGEKEDCISRGSRMEKARNIRGHHEDQDLENLQLNEAEVETSKKALTSWDEKFGLGSRKSLRVSEQRTKRISVHFCCLTKQNLVIYYFSLIYRLAGWFFWSELT